MAMCVYESYQRTLRQYHNWVVRSIFSLAMRSLPTKESFLEGLAVDGQDYLKNKQLFENQCKMDMKVIINGIDIPLNIINEFYSKNNLETQPDAIIRNNRNLNYIVKSELIVNF